VYGWASLNESSYFDRCGVHSGLNVLYISKLGYKIDLKLIFRSLRGEIVG